MRLHEKIFLAGHNGLLGKALMQQLKAKFYKNIVTRDKKDLDLRSDKQVAQFFEEEKPEYVIIAAGVSGAMEEVAHYPGEFLYDNLKIQTNLIHQAYKHGVKKLLFYGCGLMYPKELPQPIQEDYLLSSPMDKRSEPLAMAKIAGLRMCLDYNRQYDTKNIVVIPISLYGNQDRYHDVTPNTIPLFIREIHKAKKENKPEVVFPGTGELLREYLHVDDMADATVVVMRNYEFYHQPINFGTGMLASQKEIAEMVQEFLGYEGEIRFDGRDLNLPEALGFMRHKVEELSWFPKVPLDQGIESACKWYVENYQEQPRQEG